MIASLSPGYTLLLAIVFLALSLSVLVFATRNSLRRNKLMMRRLAGMPEQRTMGASTERTGQTMIEKFGKHLSLPGAEEISKIRFKLAQAGFYDVKAIPILYGVRVFALLIPQFVLLGSWAYFGQGLETDKLLLTSMVLIILGMFGPSYYIRMKVNKRRYSAKEGFPDMLDLLISCIEAGLGLDAALGNVATELGTRYPVLKMNLDLLNLELMAGRKRHDAFKNFAERLGLDEARSLTIMLKQSEEMGSSLGLALRTFSEEMRTKRMLTAEEKAMALPAKMTIPLILFIFPTIMTMLMLPTIARLAETF